MSLKFVSVVVVAFCVLNATGAHAWENNPEFQSLTETEQINGFEGPGALNPEYFSDLITYSWPSEWEFQWLTHKRALELSFGSLNTTNFAMDYRLKIQEPLTDFLEFRFTFLEESAFERQSSQHHIVELVFWPFSWLGLSVYGEPSFRKPNDDTGVALLLKPNPQHEIRIFNTFVDVTRLKYPDTLDSFIEPDLPYARGIVGRAYRDPGYPSQMGDFVEYAIRYETPTRWNFYGQNYEYDYWKWFASFYGRRQFSEKQSLAFRVQFDRKHEERTATGPTTVALGNWYTNRLTALSETTFHQLGKDRNWEGTVGLEVADRVWTTDQGVGKYRDLLPYMRLRIPAWGSGAKRGHWNLGYVLTWHMESGATQIGINPNDAGLIEQRFNLSYEFSFGEKGSLVLLASTDLDEFGTRKSWGGGSGKFQLFF